MTTPLLAHLVDKRDRPDQRDLAFAPHLHELPKSASLAHACPPVYDQGQLKSCSAHAVTAGIRVIAKITGTAVDPPSRLFIYYNARALNDDIGSDGGATIRDAIKAAAKPGACTESAWPYDESRVLERPPQSAYDSATVRICEYRRIERSLDALRACIAQGLPFVFGVSIYESSAQQCKETGHLLPPQAHDSVLGGHAVLAVGYDDTTKTFRALNSCGANFGDHGYLHVPYSYFESNEQTYDFWSICKIG